jgi:hypothetical protein
MVRWLIRFVEKIHNFSKYFLCMVTFVVAVMLQAFVLQKNVTNVGAIAVVILLRSP